MGDIIKKLPCRSTPGERPQSLRVYFDTGSPRTFVKEGVALKMMAVSKLPKPEVFSGLGNGTFHATHIFHLQVKLLDIWVPHLCYVVADNILDPRYEILLGHDFMQIYDIAVKPKKRQVIVNREALKMALKVRAYMQQDIKALNKKIAEESAFLDDLLREINKVIVGQSYMLERLLIGLLARGHILIEGVPGLAKTLAVKTLAGALRAQFQRIQFTPDLLPADLIGTLIYNPKDGGFVTRKGPIFAHIILADEINRAPAKVQSALLEAMQERQVTIGRETFPLEEPFLVLATQNPIEQEGTYPLPEAQVDRFMLKLRVTYPEKEEEMEIVNRMVGRRDIAVDRVVTPQDILQARTNVDKVYVDEKVKLYVLDIVSATRDPEKYKMKDMLGFIEYGASPRASIYLIEAGKAHAFLNHRGYVTPEDIKTIAPDVLRHRLILSYEAEAEEKTPEDIIKRILETIEVP